MIKKEDKIIMRAIALCFKPYLKPEEALIYTNLERTQFDLKCHEKGIVKTEGGYYKKEDLDQICVGGPSKNQLSANSVIASLNKRKRF